MVTKMQKFMCEVNFSKKEKSCLVWTALSK